MLIEEKDTATDADSTSEENQEESSEEVEEIEEEVEEKPSEEESIDFKEKLKDLEKEKPEQKRNERNKAQFTVNKIYERFPDLKPQEASEKDKDSDVLATLLRNQVEGVIRSEVQETPIKDKDDAIKYYMAYYDKVPKTGNIYEDADNAMWLANKNRTRNALKETKRNPGEPGAGRGAGQKLETEEVPKIAPEELKHLFDAGFRQVSPSKLESKMFILQWNKEAKQWEQIRKQPEVLK